jgi:hypothetical protein
MYALLLYALTALAALRGKNDNRKHVQDEANNNWPPFPVPLPVINIPPTPSDQERAKQEKKDRLDKWKFRFEIAGLIVLSFYTGFTYRIMRANLDTVGEIQKQTKLLRQQVVGMEATTLDFRVDIQNDLNNIPELRAIVAGVGHVAAKAIHASFDVSFKKEKQLEGEGVRQHYEIDLPQFMPSQIGNPGTGNYLIKNIGVDGLSFKTWQGMQHSTMDKTIVVKGVFRYDNGFGEIMENDFCYMWFARPNLPTIGSSDAEWIDCSRYRAKIQGWAQLEQREREQKQKNEKH